MKLRILCLLLALVVCVSGCCFVPLEDGNTETTVQSSTVATTATTVTAATTASTAPNGTTAITTTTAATTATQPATAPNEYLSERATVWGDIPAYDGESFSVVLDNKPYFTAGDITRQAFELYSNLDSLGRCGAALACCGTEIMPTGERGNISSVKPSGWVQAQYDHISGKYLYNRCHLIGWQLSAEDANPKNLITGTKHMNVEGMLPFENMVADYIRETENHVMYRITPWFYGDELVARGVQIEAYSVEDEGEGVCFNVFCHNVQPGVKLNYADGRSFLEAANTTTVTTTTASPTTTTANVTFTFILNTNTKKIHYPGCRSVKSMKASNKQEYSGTVDELLQRGYTTCGNCF